jgi:hypothetical protein
MKTQLEILQALTANKTLVYDKRVLLKLINGQLNGKSIAVGNLYWTLATGWNFDKPELYEYEEEPQWYEKNLSAGVICRVKQKEDAEWGVDVIYGYFAHGLDRFVGFDGNWRFAEPLDLTKNLMQQLFETNN